MMPAAAMIKRPAMALLAACCVVAVQAIAREARAEDAPSRFGLVLSTGGGVAGVAHTGPLPGAIGFTDLGVEVFGELRPWGLFLRADFLSSGDDGRWTTYGLTLGTQYRLFGSVHRTALFLRGGLVFEHMLGNDAGCPVAFFVPSSCNLLGATDVSTFSTHGEMLGLLGGVRVELPTPVFFVAFGASLVPTVDVAGQPGVVRVISTTMVPSSSRTS